MVVVEITESHDYDLVGRVVEVRQRTIPTELPVALASGQVSGNPRPSASALRRISTGAALRVLA
jgi:hypothetical protein